MQQGEEESGAVVRIDIETYEELVKKAVYKDTIDTILKRKLECYEKMPEAQEFSKAANRLEEYHRPLKGGRTIRISDDTHELLGMIGTNILTYDDIIRMLLKDAMTRPEVNALINAARKLERFDKHRIKSGKKTSVHIKMSTHNRLIKFGTSATSITKIMDRILGVCED